LKQLSKLTPTSEKIYQRYFDFQLDDNKNFSYSINHQKVNKEDQNSGFFCVYTTTGFKEQKIYSIYKDKAILEDGLYDLKNYLDMKRTIRPNIYSTDGKIFCSFIGLIASAVINDIISDLNKSKGQKRLSKNSLVTELEKIKIVSLANGKQFLSPVTKTQLDLLRVFELEETDLKRYALPS
jgi:transposase